MKLIIDIPEKDSIFIKTLQHMMIINGRGNCKPLPNTIINAIINGIPYEERPTGKWIPVNKKLPDNLDPVNVTYINHEPEPYYKEIKDKPFTAPAVYFNGQWYWWSTLCTDILAEYSHNYDDVIDRAIEVIAWQPLPEPYKKGGAE